MDAIIRKVKIRKYSNGLIFNLQFLPPLKGWGALEIIR